MEKEHIKQMIRNIIEEKQKLDDKKSQLNTLERELCKQFHIYLKWTPGGYFEEFCMSLNKEMECPFCGRPLQSQLNNFLDPVASLEV